MGGHAFALTHDIYTPRMPNNVYRMVLDRARAQLLTVFEKVETPIEGPAKEDHGDIDFLVLVADGQESPSVKKVAEVLGADHHTDAPAGSTVSYAVRWPDEEDVLGHQFNKLKVKDDRVSEKPTSGHKGKDVTTKSNKTTESDPNSEPRSRHIQIDVHRCPTPQILNFTLFMHSHGDLWSILGTVIRPYGLTCTQRAGLTVRIPELENVNKNLARFALTQDPDTVLRYLGLDVATYHSHFQTWHDLMDYICSCRFFTKDRMSYSLEPASAKPNDLEEDKPKETDADADSDTTIKAPKLTSHDRRKARQRPLFRYWIDVYFPSHPDTPNGSASHMSRDQVIADARKFFGPAISEAFDTHRTKHVHAMMADRTWSNIRQALPCEGSDLTHTMKGLKFEITQEAQSKEVAELDAVQLAWHQRRYADVEQWAVENWEDVKNRRIARMREQSSQKLRERRENEGERAAGGGGDVDGGSTRAAGEGDPLKVWNFYHR